MAKEKDIATKEEGAVAESGMDFLEANAGAGYEHMTSDDFVQSFIRIAQPLSPICVNGKDEYNPEAKPGLFYNVATGKLYGETLKVIPVYFKHEWLEFKPNRGGFAGKHEPHSVRVDTSDFKEWLMENGNVINDTYTFFCFLPEFPEDGLVLMSFKSTDIKPAKSWNTMISMVRTPKGGQAPFYSSVWELGVTRRESGENVWYTIGKQKANAHRLRYITAEEYHEFIVPLIELAKTAEVDWDKDQANTVEGGEAVTVNADY